MAPPAEKVDFGRIIACFAPGRSDPHAGLARLALQTRAELIGLFIEDADLLRLAALPFAAEVGLSSAVRRTLDPAAVERALRAEASRLRQSLAAALAPDVVWSLQVTRAAPSDAVRAALAEGLAPSLLIPPGGNPRAERSVLRAAELDPARLRALLLARRPVLILPD